MGGQCLRYQRCNGRHVVEAARLEPPSMAFSCRSGRGTGVSSRQPLAHPQCADRVAGTQTTASKQARSWAEAFSESSGRCVRALAVRCPRCAEVVEVVEAVKLSIFKFRRSS
eukprot:6056633-Prymnesium_polylepis.1